MIYGLDTAPLPEGYTPLSADAVIKCLNEEGRVTLVTRGTNDLMIWDSIGMLQVSLDEKRARAVQAYIPDDREED